MSEHFQSFLDLAARHPLLAAFGVFLFGLVLGYAIRGASKSKKS
jgi:hypothetical protein